MTLFYKKTIADDMIGPFFIHELGPDITNEDWEYHIGLLVDFWMASLLDEGPYWGNPSGAHFGIAHLTRESFMRWIELFSATADEIYTPEISTRFKEEGVIFANRFMDDLGI
ncbi:globin [Sulfurimonas aquatica]|uniref:Globin n=1 Tax=Sulfurimonas aquatica TaxID=2672570 RepID=A0A975GBW2_9BACT|nr:group III truncated hemoglobin [Sulfurimonas aquatica]QSZ41106.1 globin [Sulfurimonas aquatica]